jgi:hypothetical protein
MTDKIVAPGNRKVNEASGLDQKGWAARQMSNEIKNRSLQRFGPNRENREIFVEDRDRLQTNFLERMTTGIQTDPIPPKPVPKLDYTFPTGIDKDIQVVEAELFNFELEVQPTVHALASRVLNEGLHETQHETDISKLRDMKSRARAQAQAAAAKEDQFFAGEQKRLVQLGQTREGYARQHDEAVEVSRKMLSRTMGKDAMEPLKEDLEDFLGKFGKQIDSKLCQTTDALKDELFRGVVRVQGQLSVAKTTVKEMTQSVLERVLGESARLKEAGLSDIETKRATELAVLTELLPEFPDTNPMLEEPFFELSPEQESQEPKTPNAQTN